MTTAIYEYRAIECEFEPDQRVHVTACPDGNEYVTTPISDSALFGQALVTFHDAGAAAEFKARHRLGRCWRAVRVCRHVVDDFRPVHERVAFVEGADANSPTVQTARLVALNDLSDAVTRNGHAGHWSLNGRWCLRLKADCKHREVGSCA